MADTPNDPGTSAAPKPTKEVEKRPKEVEKLPKTEIKDTKEIKHEKIEKIEIKDHKDFKIEKIEKNENKEHKDTKIEKIEKNEFKEHKDAKHEKQEKNELKEHKDAKHEKTETKIENKELKIENKEIGKIEHPEKPIGKEKDGKEIVEIPGGDPGNIAERLGALEQSVGNMQHFITSGERPDLSRGALSGEPPAVHPEPKRRGS